MANTDTSPDTILEKLLRMENVEEEAGSEVLGHVLGAREAAGCWREV